MNYKCWGVFFVLMVTNAMAAVDPFYPNNFAEKKPAVKLPSVITLHYVSAKYAKELLVNYQVKVSGEKNALLVFESPKTVDLLKSYLQKIDVPTAQILIKAQVISLENNLSRELGINWQIKHNDFNISLPNIAAQNEPFKIAIATPNQHQLLQMELMALIAEGYGNIIASPQLLTLSGKPAHIASGDQVPYQEKTSSGATSTDFKNALLSLKVTPSTLQNNEVLLDLQVNQDKVSPLAIENVPFIRTQQIQSHVRVRSGDTIILGGVTEESWHQQQKGVPVLSQLPLLGALFRTEYQTVQHKELLVLVTPTIVP